MAKTKKLKREEILELIEEVASPGGNLPKGQTRWVKADDLIAIVISRTSKE